MSFPRCFMFWATFVAVIFMNFANGFPTTGDSVVVTTNNEPTVTPANEIASTVPKITSMNVNSNISARYANTLVTSRVFNPAKRANEVTFSVVIPETAFITGFSMEIDGKEYEAYVKEKEEAKKVYETAVSSGQSAAHVAVQARDSNHFTVSINLEPESKAIFRLRYEELLIRRLNLYNHVINLNPGQILDKLSVDINIKENSPISILLVPELRSGNEIDAEPTDKPNTHAQITYKDNKHQANVHFSPTKEQQLELMEEFKNKEKEHTTKPPFPFEPFEPSKQEGLSGQFVVQYDVDGEDQGQVLVHDGYFVHFFAPKTIKPLSKHVIFVLDVSGSMYGKKIVQLKEAMTSILQELNPKDYFNIIEFSYNAKVYDLDDSTKNVVYGSRSHQFYEDVTETIQSPETIPPKAKPATTENINKAKNIINQLSANGGTNIHEALSTALKVANYGIEAQSSPDDTTLAAKTARHEPIVIFLTDGDPTVGETSTDKILSTMKKLNQHKTVLFSLAFGEDADRSFLRKLSLQNFGFMRHIYEAADAAMQLKNFYRQVSSPLLSNIQYIYPEDEVDKDSVTQTKFNHFFLGSELIVAGKLVNTEVIDLPITVKGMSESGPIDYTPIVINLQKKRKFWPLERLWAYLNIKQLLDESEAKEDKDLKQKALDVALKYSFVTPLTSLVVVKPNSTSSVDPEALPGSGQPGNRYGSSYALPLIAGHSPNSASFHQSSIQFKQPGGGDRGVPLSNRFYFPPTYSNYPVMRMGGSMQRMAMSRQPVASYITTPAMSQSYSANPSYSYQSIPVQQQAAISYPVASGMSIAAYPSYDRGSVMQRGDTPQENSFTSESDRSSFSFAQAMPVPQSAYGASFGSSSFSHIPHQGIPVQGSYDPQGFGYKGSSGSSSHSASYPIYPQHGVPMQGSYGAHGFSGSQGIPGPPSYMPTYSSPHQGVPMQGSPGSYPVLTGSMPNKAHYPIYIPQSFAFEESEFQDPTEFESIEEFTESSEEITEDAISAPMYESAVPDSIMWDADDDIALDFDIRMDENPTTMFGGLPTTDDSPTSTFDPMNNLTAYGLENFSWVEQYLSLDNKLVFPKDGIIVTYNLKTQTDDQTEAVNPPSCPNSVSGGSGVCKYLTQCDEINEAFKDLTTYVKYSCNHNGYAGICCTIQSH